MDRIIVFSDLGRELPGIFLRCPATLGTTEITQSRVTGACPKVPLLVLTIFSLQLCRERDT